MRPGLLVAAGSLPAVPGPAPRPPVRRAPVGRRRVALALALALASAAVLVVAAATGPAGASARAGAQEPTSTAAPEVAPVDAQPGGGDPAADPGASRAPSTSTPALGERVSESQAATTRLNRVVIALVVLAVVIAAVTVVFWRATRPLKAQRGSGAAMRWEVPEHDAESARVVRRKREDAGTAEDPAGSLPP